MASEESARDLVSCALGEEVVATTQAAWGFQNRTDIVTLAGGERVVLQRYRRREDAEYRLRGMRALSAAPVAMPDVRAADLDADPAWAIFAALPGVPAPEADATATLARPMGELLAAIQRLPTAGVALDDLWSDPQRLADRATRWAAEIEGVDDVIARVPELFANRPAVIAHGDFAPVNVLTDGATLTGLLDFESARLADPLFDPAWWHWSVGFSPPGVLRSAWPEFLAGAGLADDPERIQTLQILRMLELLAGPTLSADVRRIVADRLSATMR